MAKRWFMVSKQQSGGGLFSLFYEETAFDVSRRRTGQEEGGHISELSERGLIELVGHNPNLITEPSDHATGPILLNYDGRIITIHG